MLDQDRLKQWEDEAHKSRTDIFLVRCPHCDKGKLTADSKVVKLFGCGSVFNKDSMNWSFGPECIKNQQEKANA